MGFTLLGILNAQAVGAQVPEPAFLTSAPLWLDAADASTITASSGSVSQWDNKGTQDNFVQGASLSQPTTGVSSQNGLNLLDFNGSLMEQAGSIGSFNFLHNGTDFFIVAVIQYQGSSISGFLASCIPTNLQTGLSVQVRMDATPNAIEATAHASNGAGAVLSVSDDSLYTFTDFHIFSGLGDLNNGTASERFDYFNNNTQGLVTNTDTIAPSSSNSTSRLTLGSRPGGAFPMAASLGELIIVSGADATETNRQATVDYLNSKWGVF